jgi:putative ABC transport system ATP-binding protein
VPSEFLAVEDVSVSFGKGAGKMCALRNASLAFAPRTLSLIMGPSGSGKTTLLSLLGCLLSPERGRVFIDGVSVHDLDEKARTSLRRSKISFVFQAFRLMHSLSAIDNVALALEIRDLPRPQQTNRASRMLKQFGLESKMHLEPDELSPGEKQRVALARALVVDPAIILADEPTASLDQEAGTNVCEVLRKQVDENGKTIVVVSHDPRWERYADRRVVLSHGQIEGALS